MEPITRDELATTAAQPLILDPEPEPAYIVPEEDAPRTRPGMRWIVAGILVLLALASIFAIRPVASSPETYRSQIETLDEKKGNVMALTVMATGASAAISAIPGDAGSAIATKLADLSSYLIVILTVIYFEKFMLTTLGMLGFGILVPAGLIALAAMALAHQGGRGRMVLMQLGMRAVVFGLAISLVVPASVWVTDQIDATFADSISYEINDSQTSAKDEAAKDDTEEEQSGGVLDSIATFFKKGVETVSNAAQETLNGLANRLNQLVDTIAVMIVTSCLVPLAVLITFFWLAKAICGIDLGGPDRIFSAASRTARRARKGVVDASTKAREKAAAKAAR